MNGRERPTKERPTIRESDPALRVYSLEETFTPPANGLAAQLRAADLAEAEARPPAPSAGHRARTPTPRRLGKLLLLARESKGVDLERAAQDTKIRTKYLAALEAGDFRELPGTVYTKGFLRNYAKYLGLDPETVIARYKREVGSRANERVALVLKTLRPLRSGITLTRGLVASVVLTLLLVAFAGYLTAQVLRYSWVPELAITQPSGAETTVDAETTILAGTASAGATVTVTSPDGVLNTTASSAGAWSLQVPLRKGSNTFWVVAIDPETAKRSAQVSIIVTVPLPSPAQAPVLSLSSPADGSTFTNGAIPIAGTTSGTTVSVSATYLGPPTLSRSGLSTPAPPPPPPATEIAVAANGSFGGSYPLTPGSWRLTITGTGSENLQTSLSRTITVAYSGVQVVVEIKGGRAWLRVRVDGALSDETPTTAGRIFENGTKLTFSAKQLVEIRTGVASITYVTVNDVPYGPLGTSTNPGTWAIGPEGPQPE